MKVLFRKMQGTANDFIVINNYDGIVQNKVKQLAIAMCDRRLGVGADGLILIEPSPKASFKMRIINSDGSEAGMCGNGIRCAFKYVVDKKLVDPKERSMTCSTGAGLLTGSIEEGGIVSVRMADPQNIRTDILLETESDSWTVHSIDTGVPHAVLFVDRLDDCDIESIGQAICEHDFFRPHKTNVDCVEVLDEQTIRIRTYERGVYSETEACGTGATASAIIANRVKGIKNPIKVLVNGGELVINFMKKDTVKLLNVSMTGPAETVFDGEYHCV